MNRRKFQTLYNLLQDEQTAESAIYLIKEQGKLALDLFKQELDNESDNKVKRNLAPIYNDIITQQYPQIISQINDSEYISTETIFGHYTSFIFDYKSYETQFILSKFTDKLISKLDKKTLYSQDSIAIIKEINQKLTQSFIIDNSFAHHYNFNEASKSMTISQYSLAIIYLILAEKLSLPIYGIPFEDKLVLCYAESYCSHNELVFQEDILYYIVIGERDLVYTPVDLQFYAMLLEQEIDLKSKLPHSNQSIIQNWLKHLVGREFDSKTRENLSSKYQQILSPISEFEDI